jgi:hypothetical protein
LEDRFGDDRNDEFDLLLGVDRILGVEWLCTLGVERILGIERTLGVEGVTRRISGSRCWFLGLECLMAPLGMEGRRI